MAAEFTQLVDRLKAWLDLGQTAPHQKFDGVLMDCIEDAEEIVSYYCGRGDAAWLTATRTEYFSGTFNGELVLTFTPVTALTSVTDVYSATTAGVESGTTGGLEINRFTVDGFAPGAAFTAKDGILAFRNVSSNPGNAFESGGDIVTLPRYYPVPNFGDGKANIKVVYTGGFATVAATPGRLLRAIMECAAELAVESPAFSEHRERASTNKGRWKELAGPYVRGGGIL